MPDESRYDAALAASFAILHRLNDNPDMPGYQRLACVTFAILEAMNHVAEQRSGRRIRPEPSVN
jgi:hypothetical protein